MTVALLVLIALVAVAAFVLTVLLRVMMRTIDVLVDDVTDLRKHKTLLTNRLNEVERSINHRMQELETEFDAFNELRLESLFDEVLGDDQPFEPDTDMED